ncbi:hypothetical protein G7076_06920 [Sphingomonas sp. HDW15A]|uniref:hypothetical protein n=1 Tax=Sphingomonas sp. HDW15A TaxID=2714942 RepID=UPI0014098EDD|nr:hypothetical protein [Sphingomonas sp. HDW15A]QIK96212.1 hypothetical protein G7076_06920 [Sphingomonas sp. HDW15A]
MIAATLLFLVATPTDLPTATPEQTANQVASAKPSKNTTKSCREMLLSSSRLGAVKICKTRAEWRRWDDCHRSVTRYCTPEKKSQRLYSEWKHDRMICKDIKETGSRLSTQRVCSTAREWRLAEEEAQKALRDRQSISTLSNEGSDGAGFAPHDRCAS